MTDGKTFKPRGGCSRTVGRTEFTSCLYRDREGRIVEAPVLPGEPDPYDVPADLDCPDYEVTGGLFGPPKLGDLGITIFNTRSYRRDSELEEAAKDHLVQAILRKEGPGIADAAGGIQAVKDRIEIDTFWIEEG